MATVDVVNAVFLVGSLAKTIINKRLKKTKRSRAWFGNSVSDFVDTKGITNIPKLSRLFKVTDVSIERFVLKFIESRDSWRAIGNIENTCCWIPVYEATKTAGASYNGFLMNIDENEQKVGLLYSRPTAAISMWALIAASWADGASFYMQSNDTGAEVVTMMGRHTIITIKRGNIDQPWNGNIVYRQQIDDHIVTRDTWINLVRHGSSAALTVNDWMVQVHTIHPPLIPEGALAPVSNINNLACTHVMNITFNNNLCADITATIDWITDNSNNVIFRLHTPNEPLEGLFCPGAINNERIRLTSEPPGDGTCVPHEVLIAAFADIINCCNDLKADNAIEKSQPLLADRLRVQKLLRKLIQRADLTEKPWSNGSSYAPHTRNAVNRLSKMMTLLLGSTTIPTKMGILGQEVIVYIG